MNHPLQSLHAMHPGGGDLLTTEVSSQEAAAAVAFAVQQQQSYQLSLSRANTGTDSGWSMVVVLFSNSSGGVR